MTEQQLNAILQRNPQLIKVDEHNTRCPLPNPKPERHKASALGKAIRGEADRVQRVIIRFTGFRVKPLDPDNFAGSVKDLLDGLRHAHVIGGDENWRIKLETEQVKVSHYKDEKTVIEIDDQLTHPNL